MTTDLKIDGVGQAEMVIACAPLSPTLDFFVERLGFRVETIFPAEDPQIASISGHGLRLRLEPRIGDPGTIRLTCDAPGQTLIAPNGARIELVAADAPVDLAPFVAEFLINRRGEGPAENVGRAGMIYRDLIPSRLGGRYVASQISIPDGGPVADWVHYHKIGFQMIFCRRGWARLVYEDQGPPFIMAAGDCVLQPPRIRHRVLETSAAFEVVEIGCPALHETLADHDMALPTGRTLPQRDFGGQLFHHHIAADAPWTSSGDADVQATGLATATKGIVDVQVLRRARGDCLFSGVSGGELIFGFMLEGSASLRFEGEHPLGATDTIVIPPGRAWTIDARSADATLLLVSAPG